MNVHFMYRSKLQKSWFIPTDFEQEITLSLETGSPLKQIFEARVIIPQ